MRRLYWFSTFSMKHLSLLHACVLLSCSCVSAVVLTACGPDEVILPKEPQTIEGVLLARPLALHRRGTHVLQDLQGNDLYYAESATVNLHEYEELAATVTGVLEKNTDPDAMPVLVVSGVVIQQRETRSWEIASLGLSLQAPKRWSCATLDDGMQCLETGSTTPVVKIYSSALMTMPAGSETQVGGRRAVRLQRDDGEVVYVQNGTMIITFSFPSVALQDGVSAREAQLLLHSVDFIAKFSSSSAGMQQSSPSLSSSSAVSTEAFCGGAAGILCPQGKYCEITDRENGIGHCRSITQ